MIPADRTSQSGRVARVQQFLIGLLTTLTRGRYEKALADFNEWLARHCVPWDSLNEEDQDWLLADAILDWRDDGMSLQAARDLVSAVQKVQPRRRYLTAWRVIGGWALDRPVQSAPPLPRELALALSVLFAGTGDYAMSFAVIVAWAGLLRVGEALGLHWSQCVRGTGCYVLLLPRTKRGLNERVVLSDSSIVAFIDELLARIDTPPAGQISCLSYEAFRRRFLQGLKALGCENFGFRSHSLRRGGATALAQAGVDMQSIMVFGRWASLQSCRLYVRAGDAELIALRRSLAGARAQRVALLARLGARVFYVSAKCDATKV